MPLHKESDILECDPFSSWIKLLTRDKCRLEEEIIKKITEKTEPGVSRKIKRGMNNYTHYTRKEISGSI